MTVFPVVLQDLGRWVYLEPVYLGSISGKVWLNANVPTLDCFAVHRTSDLGECFEVTWSQNHIYAPPPPTSGAAVALHSSKRYIVYHHLPRRNPLLSDKTHTQISKSILVHG